MVFYSGNQADGPASQMEVKLPAVRTGLPRHADGLISVRATSTKCPSQELKIEDSGKAQHQPGGGGGGAESILQTAEVAGKYKSSAQYFFSQITSFRSEVSSCPR